MNAVNPVHSPGVPNAAEPSMEEILASIRRIIADDTTLRPVDISDHGSGHAVSHGDAGPHEEATQAFAVELAPPEPPESESPESESPGLELAQHELAEPAPLAHGAPAADGLPEGHGNIAAPQFPSPEGPMAEPIAELPRHPLAPPMGHGPVEPVPELAPIPPLLHDEDVAETSAHADVSNPEPLLSAAADSSVTSAFNMLAASRLVDNSEQLAGLVRDMIRPLVKAWVDEHLPGLVERLVVAEIERMARR